MKLCCRCQKEKGPEDFYKARNHRDGLQYVCKECTLILNRNSRLKNAEKIPHNRRKQSYGILPDQFARKLSEQGGRCAICKLNLGKRLQVDHHHTSGKFRGLLCHGCNVGIGFFKDSSAIARAAADYLDKTK